MLLIRGCLKEYTWVGSARLHLMILPLYVMIHDSNYTCVIWHYFITFAGTSDNVFSDARAYVVFVAYLGLALFHAQPHSMRTNVHRPLLIFCETLPVCQLYLLTSHVKTQDFPCLQSRARTQI